MVSHVPGRLKKFADVWSEFTNDKFILNVINGYKILFNELPVQMRAPPEPVSSIPQEQGYFNSITRLLKIGAIKKCILCSGQFLSSYFLVDKSNGTKRFILNLKKLNGIMTLEHFKMEDIRTAMRLLSQDFFMANIDLCDSYHSVAIRPGDRKFLRFSWKGQLFEYTCLPFGLCTASWLFTKIIKPIVNYVRMAGFMFVVYLDDWLCLGTDYTSCLKNVKITIEVLEKVGFIINHDKSSLTPAQTSQFFGFVITSPKMLLELPKKKKLN